MRSRVSRRAVLVRAVAAGWVLGVLPLLEACSSAAPTTAPAAGAKPTTASAPTAAPAIAPASGSGGGLVYLNQSRGQAKALESLATKYTQQTGIQVTIDSPGPTDYPKKLQAAGQGILEG